MSLENKKPEFIQRLTLKKVVVSLSGVILLVSLVAGAGIYLFSSNSDNKKNIDYNNSNKLKYSDDINGSDSVDKLIKKEDASDPYSSIVDPGVASVLSSNQPNSSSTVNNGGTSGYKPLYSTDDKLAYKDKFDWDHASDEEIRKYVEQQEGQKLVKVGTYRTNTDDTKDWRNSPNNKTVDNVANNPIDSSNKLPLVFDSLGNQILGWDNNSNPIIGYDKNGKPILGKNPQGIIGFDSNKNPLSKNDLAKALNFDNNYAKKNVLYDKNGSLIIGYDKNGNPIIGYDKNGKPILGVTENGVLGYDSLGKPISKNDMENKLYQSSGFKLYDKNGKPILGWDNNGNPILGYDSNGKPILGKNDKDIAGYDSNGKPILKKNLDNLLIQKNLAQNLQNKILKDKNGKEILGWDNNGNPIIGYDKNGNPIIGAVDKGVAGYDATGKPIAQNELQSYLKQNAADSILSKSSKPSLYDKNGNLIIGYDNSGKPIIGYDTTGKAIMGVVDKGVAGYDATGKPITQNELSNYMNNTLKSNPASAIDNIAGVGNLGNSQVPPLNGYQPSSGNVVNIEPTKLNTGTNIAGIQFNPKNITKQKESNPWDEQLSKTNPEADKAQLNINLNYKNTNESQNTQNNYGANSNNSLDTKNESSNYSNKENEPLKYVKLNSRYTAKAGTFIPMLMQTGINSDLPGPILGKVSTNVYDTATGKYLLIPQGSTLLGSYSANVSYGQTRILIAWNSLIFPNGDEVKLSGQAGTDLEGYAGLNDQVNNHYWALFGNTFILSVLTAGLEYNQNNNSNSMNNGSSFSSSLSNSSGQMMGQAAAGVIQKSINIAPTLTIRNGFRGNVLLTQDLTLPSTYKMKLYNPSK